MEISLGILIGIVLARFCVYLANREQYPYSYHVAYNFGKEDRSSGMGAMNVKRSRRITSTDEVKNVREFIEKENNFKDVVIINWILLK